MNIPHNAEPLPTESAALGAVELGPDVFPLSFSQEGLWVFEQMNPGTAAYNLPQAWRLEGRLNVPALEAAIGAIVARHEALRTVFSTCGGQPRQMVLAAKGTPLPVTDLSVSLDPETKLSETLQLEARRKFDLVSGPPVRAHLFRLGPEEHVLLLKLHHIISDEWSMKVFLDELAAHYQAVLSGNPVKLPDLPIQYADFAVWQRGLFSSDPSSQSINYWRAKLRGPRAVLDLPTDRPRPPRQSYDGATLFSEVPEDLLIRLKELAGQEHLTLFMVLTATFKALLHRYTRQTDLLIGSPVSGMARMETERLIGFFVNTLTLRTDLEGDPSFLGLLQRVRDTVLEAYAHQETPLEKVVEAVNPERDSARHPLFP
ncbi:MAG: condensation domain-containing protein, partial [Limisphaerales bacterium]